MRFFRATGVLHILPIVFLFITGLTGCDELTKTNTSPIALFTVNPASGTTDTLFTFDASGSSDKEDAGESLQVRWDWESDGTWDTSYSLTSIATHQFDVPGSYAVRLEVEDSDGLSDTTSVEVGVGAVNAPPVASFSVSATTGSIATEFAFDASACTDPEDDSSSLEIRWDWEGDGTWDTDWSTTRTAVYAFPAIGVYSATLIVRDSDGLYDTSSRAITIENSAPTASITVTPDEGPVSTLFAFDAGASSDLEDALDNLEVRWDWESDGNWDTPWSAGKTADHQYVSESTYFITLEVRDTAGLQDTARDTVTVGLTWSEMNSFTSDDILGIWGASATDVFAVGRGGSILHFDGSSWSPMNSGTTSYYFKGVWGTSATDIFVVGQSGKILHYNGTAWSTMSSGTSESMYDVWGPSSSDVYAVGNHGTIKHYNGTSWSTMTAPTEASGPLYSIWGSSATDIWAAGGTSSLSSIIIHYDGTAWSTVHTGGGSLLQGIWAASATDIYTAGWSHTILHYDGASWATVNSSHPWAYYDIWGSSATDIFAAGVGAVAHFDGTGWKDIATPVSVIWNGIWGDETGSFFIVGNDGHIYKANR
ncbi:PKD domain-containing protein [Candidatus Zixiibacteriota bacterium]